MASSFKDFVNSYESMKTKPKELTDEDKFQQAIGVKIPSLNAFTAWLILNNKIKPYIIDERTERPRSLFGVPGHSRILHFVNVLPKIKVLAEEFSSKYK